MVTSQWLMSAVLGTVFISNVVLPVESLRILGVFPTPARSHWFLGQILMKELAAAGHEVTMVTTMPLKEPMKNYRDIVLPDRHYMFHVSEIDGTNITFNAQKQKQKFASKFHFFNIELQLTDLMLQDEPMQKLLNSPNETFDVVIVEVVLNEALYAIANHFNAPLITFSSFGSYIFTNELVGNVAPVATVPDLMLGFSDKMNFPERFLNAFVSNLNLLLRYYWYMPKQEAIMQKYFKNVLNLYDIMFNTSLVVLNSHFSMTYPQPAVPNIIEIGGFHVGKPKPLPEDLQKFIDESPHGVIYFSMGTFVLSKDFKAEKRDAFLKAFSGLKQRILWKWEDDNLPNKPKNLMTRKWFPQTDILAHPNVKLFITHGGMLSSTEAVARGVPILGIPILGDQINNIGQAVAMGYAIQIDFTNITEQSISWGINEILNNPKYTENIKERSRVFNDREVDPLKSFVYWIEYVVRHKGAHHLRCSTTGMPLYKYLLLDVIALVSTVLLLFLAIIVIIMKKIYKICCSNKSKLTSTAQKKKKQ